MMDNGMFKRYLKAFSLMEMMVVMLIIAIIAAATAPMVTKKMAGSGSSECPWLFTEGNNISFPAANNSSVLIGLTQLLNYANHQANHEPGLFVQSSSAARPQISLNTQGNNDLERVVNIIADTSNNRLALASGIIQDNLGNRSITIGHFNRNLNGGTGEATAQNPDRNGALGADSIAIGSFNSENGVNEYRNTRALGNGSIAIGKGVFAEVENGIAIGTNSKADSPYAGNNATNVIAIGHNAEAGCARGIAIGNNAQAGLGLINNTLRLEEDAIAIGSDVVSRGIAIGHGAQAEYSTSIAIGPNTHSATNNNIVIGWGADDNHKLTGSASDSIVLGNVDTTVVIPGNLIIGRSLFQGVSGNFSASLRYNNNGNISHISAFNSSVTQAGSVQYPSDPTQPSLGDYYSISDRRLKNVGKKFTAGLEELKKLDLYNYTFKKDENKTPHVGIIAQDLQKIFPDAVIKGEDGFLRVRTEDMFYAAINAIKQLDEKIQAVIEQVKKQAEEFVTLKSKVEKQQAEIEELQKQNAELVKQNADIIKRLEKLEKKAEK